ncbi:linear amide C-N hydrolase [Acuticoccus sediminis]|uniref:linear amide C-N hydrolase n=1 Tax=Acuticoccus sediminis TaxID=2184697 RepID=UPI001CFCF11D|nr:linear amide C-N hydrolase [Acuticoccus sediminis]
MCTSLVYTDASGQPYFGRTLELTINLPYQVAYLPAGFAFQSQVGDHVPVDFTAKYPFVAVTMPGRMPTADAPLGLADLKVVEGLNAAGLTFSVLSYPAAGGGQQAVDRTREVLAAADLGGWALGQFATVAELKAALETQPVMLEPLAVLGGAPTPFHYVVHDAAGASLVIEFTRGERAVYDNPVGVMTNGPEFTWHLTNLGNYTFLSNVDTPSATFGTYMAVQPDSGIATAGLPSSNTSVGRFVRAAYYAQFTEKAATPDAAVLALAHIMNNFDRPRGVTIDYPAPGGGHLEVQGLEADGTTAYATEFTTWTSLADLTRRLFFVRDYGRLNYTRIDLAALATLVEPRLVPLAGLPEFPSDGTDALRAAPSR